MSNFVFIIKKDLKYLILFLLKTLFLQSANTIKIMSSVIHDEMGLIPSNIINWCGDSDATDHAWLRKPSVNKTQQQRKLPVL